MADWDSDPRGRSTSAPTAAALLSTSPGPTSSFNSPALSAVDVTSSSFPSSTTSAMDTGVGTPSLADDFFKDKIMHLARGGSPGEKIMRGFLIGVAIGLVIACFTCCWYPCFGNTPARVQRRARRRREREARRQGLTTPNEAESQLQEAPANANESEETQQRPG